MKDFLAQYRIFPRVILIFMLCLTWRVAEWFMALEVPGVEQAGFATGLTAASVAFFKFYMETPKTKPQD
jgi:hypothetical protein